MDMKQMAHVLKCASEHILEEIECYAEYMECAEKFKDIPEIHELYISMANEEYQHFMKLHNLVGGLFKETKGVEVKMDMPPQKTYRR